MRKVKEAVLLGFPDDLGVSNVGGRAGAALGPSTFRRVMQRCTPELSRVLKDLGDVTAFTTSIEENHCRAAEVLRHVHPLGGISVIIGGGHDYAFPHLCAINAAYERKCDSTRIGCVSLDRYLDVRKPSPLITSRSGFYLAIESGVLDPKCLVEFGIQYSANVPALREYARRQGIIVLQYEALKNGASAQAMSVVLAELASTCEAIVVSFDIGCTVSTLLPDLTAPGVEVFVPSEILEMMDVLGSNDKVVSLGIFELNPKYDTSDQTAYLAVAAAERFLRAAGIHSPP